MVLNALKENQMDLVRRATEIMISPIKVWEEIRQEQNSNIELFRRYICLLALIPIIAELGSYILTRVSTLHIYVFKGTSKYDDAFNSRVGLISLILIYLSILIGAYIWAMVIDYFGKFYGCSRNFNDSLKIAAYSLTPIWLISIFGILPYHSSFVWLGLLYAAILLHFGIRTVKAPAPDKMNRYYAVALVSGLFIEQLGLNILSPVTAALLKLFI
jgi:hypothetical protein